MGRSSEASTDRAAVETTPKLQAWNEGGDDVAALERVLAHIREVADVGMCGSPQPEFLFCLSSALKGVGEVVEIGTSVGHSLVALAVAQRLNAGVKVTTIDIARHLLLDDHIRRADVEGWVEVIVKPSGEVARTWSKPVELLWIDGDHEYPGVRRDILAWREFVVPGGFIALHDYAPGFGVGRAVNETLLAEPWRWRVASDREFGQILVFERIDHGAESAWQARGSGIAGRAVAGLRGLKQALRR